MANKEIIVKDNVDIVIYSAAVQAIADIGISTMDSWARTFNSMLGKIGKVWYFHCARHFFTSYLLEQNLPENVVQSLQGWASSDMVRIYDDRTNESQFEKYFGSEGINQVEKKGLADL